jgi:hypothetical protein
MVIKYKLMLLLLLLLLLGAWAWGNILPITPGIYALTGTFGVGSKEYEVL